MTGRPHYKPTINSTAHASMQTWASEANLAFVKRGGLHRALRSNRFAALPPPGFRVRISSKRLHHATP